MPSTVDGVDLIAQHGFEAAMGNNGALTIPANTTGHPAVAIPVGLVEGLPVSMQIIGRRHTEQLLLDLARIVELERPWPSWRRVRPSEPPAHPPTGLRRGGVRCSTSGLRMRRPAQHPWSGRQFWGSVDTICDFRFLPSTTVCRILIR